MSESCPTVKVKAEVTEDNDQGFILINEEDFDEEKHELFTAATKPAKKSGKKSWE